MGARRFFIDGTFGEGAPIEFLGSDARKIATVLRLKSGDAVEVVDSAGTSFEAVLDVRGGRILGTLGIPLARHAESGPQITVAQGVPKGQKMDFVVEKLTELGAAAIVPFVSERSVVRDVGDAKLERWRRLAKTAAQQSGRDAVPAIEPAREFLDLTRAFADYDLVLFPWELADERPSPEQLRGVVLPARKILIAIGPEGGFSHVEADAAQASGAIVFSLGRRILRTETAGLAVLSVLNFLMGN